MDILGGVGVSGDNRIETTKLLRDHAWDWFAYHADQRMTALRFFLLLQGVLAVGFYQTWNSNHYELSIVFAGLSGAFSVLFWRLDLRTRELIKVGEDLLSQAEQKISEVASSEVSILKQVDAKSSIHATKFMPTYFYSYGQIFSAIFCLLLLVSVAAAGAAVLRAAKQSSASPPSADVQRCSNSKKPL